MADRCVVTTWGAPVAGREERGLEVFNEALGFYGKCAQDGRIESLDVMLLTPNAGINGFIVLKGTADQLNALKEDDEYRRILTDANLVVKDLCVVDGAANEGVADYVQRYQDSVSRVPQTA